MITLHVAYKSKKSVYLVVEIYPEVLDRHKDLSVINHPIECDLIVSYVKVYFIVSYYVYIYKSTIRRKGHSYPLKRSKSFPAAP